MAILRGASLTPRAPDPVAFQLQPSPQNAHVNTHMYTHTWLGDRLFSNLVVVLTIAYAHQVSSIATVCELPSETTPFLLQRPALQHPSPLSHSPSQVHIYHSKNLKPQEYQPLPHVASPRLQSLARVSAGISGTISFGSPPVLSALLANQVPVWYEARSLASLLFRCLLLVPALCLPSFLGEMVPFPYLHCPRLRPTPHPEPSLAAGVGGDGEQGEE